MSKIGTGGVARVVYGHVTHHDDCGCLTAQVQELLAVIHRDGGHHTNLVGLRQSITDARNRISAERSGIPFRER